MNGTPKILPAPVLRRMNLNEDGDLFDAEILAWCRHLDVPIMEMGVDGWDRHGGKSTTSLHSAWRMYAGAIGLKRRISW